MTDPTYSLELAIRADERAKAAHERLDRMNGSIDRLANEVSATNGKIDTIAQSLSRSDGFEEGEETQRRLLVDSRRFVITTIGFLFVGLVTVTTMLLTGTHVAIH